MTTPRIEDMVEEVASVCDEVEFLHGVPVKLPSQTKALLRGKVREALTELRQDTLDEAVGVIKSKKIDDFEDDANLTNNENRLCKSIWKQHNQALDDTIKALQDNK